MQGPFCFSTMEVHHISLSLHVEGITLACRYIRLHDPLTDDVRILKSYYRTTIALKVIIILLIISTFVVELAKFPTVIMEAIRLLYGIKSKAAIVLDIQFTF